MSSAEANPSLPASSAPHPKGLWVLFITEMWERFSYYGMRALLVLYLIHSTTGQNPGFGWTEDQAYQLYGYYTAAVYITPLIGGILADNFLGTHRSMLIGAWIITAGHVVLACTELFMGGAPSVISMEQGASAYLTFITGLVLIVVGTGFFKPCVSVMVGELYEEGDPRRDNGFTIFYMGINLGAFLSPFIAGTLGEKVGWHWGFGAAAVGMMLGLAVYQVLRPKYLAHVGELKPRAAPSEDGGAEEEDRTVLFQRLAVIIILALLGNILFWAFFEQAGSSLNVFAEKMTNRTILGYEFPATWYQSVNPLTIVLCAPLFSMLWTKLTAIGKNPSTPLKFALGQWLLGLAFLAMVAGSLEAQTAGKASWFWLLFTYVVCTWGELCLSPVGLSMVTKLAPPRLQALMMGLWFLSMAAANFVGALVARLSHAFLPGPDGSPAAHSFVFAGLPGFFLLLVTLPLFSGILLAALSPLIKKMMHGAA